VRARARARAAAASLPSSIAFNLSAQTSQLAARINLGSPPARGTGRAARRKRRGGRGEEEEGGGRESDSGSSRCSQKSRETERGDNRPITWLTEDDRARESPATEVYTANATRAAKPIHKAGSPAPDVHVDSPLAPLAVVLFVAAVAA